jgi:uncharacterized protein with PIN domain
MKEALKLALEFIERVNKDGWILADFEPQMYTTITAIKAALAQQADHSEQHLDMVKAQPAQPEERNFCPRCGKRTADLTVIHTCTPPQENT